MRWAALALVALLAGCANAGMGLEPTPIVDAGEPGPRLVVSGRVVDAATGEPVPEASVVVYQTDQTGVYAPADPSDESTARIRGDLTTDSEGRFAFLTVQPGEYPDQPPGNRHIHFHQVAAEGYEPMGFVLLFDDNVRPEVREWAETTGFGFVVELTGAEETGLEASVEIELVPSTG